MEFKVGDIVVIKSHEKALSGWRKSAPMNLVTEIINEGYGEDKVFRRLNNKIVTTNYPNIRFRYATEREKFLYHILGVYILGEENKDDY